MEPRLPLSTTPRGERKRLLRLFERLSAGDRNALLAFAEFLVERGADEADGGPAEPLRPQPLERPPRESVVGAIKRLSASYSMLDRGVLFARTSELMSSHLVGGRPSAEVIDELEILFAEHYEAYLGRFER